MHPASLPTTKYTPPAFECYMSTLQASTRAASRVDPNVEHDDLAADGGSDARDPARGDKVERAHEQRALRDLEHGRLRVRVRDVVDVDRGALGRAARRDGEVVMVRRAPPVKKTRKSRKKKPN